MEFIDLHAQYAALKKDIDLNIQKVLEHGHYIMGPEVAELEEKLANYVGVKYCISCANGTDALSLVLMALNIGNGDAVFVPAYTFMATAEVVSLRGATPVFVDIDLDTFNMDPKKLEEAIQTTILQKNLKPAALIPVDLYGLPANYPEIEKIAQKYNLFVIEDGAQGFGGSIDGKMSCSFGLAATTSFFPAKPLGCYGDGGAIFTNDDSLANILLSLRVHGKGTEKYDNVRIGVNSRLDTLQAAILLPKLKAFIDYELQARNKCASLYTDILTSVLKDAIKTPFIPSGFVSNWAQYSIILKYNSQRAQKENVRNFLQSELKKLGIPTMIYYPKPLNQQTAYINLGYENVSMPVSENTSQNILCLPMHPYLSEETISNICKAVKSTL